MRIFIFGAYSRVGTYLSSHYIQQGHEIIRQGRSKQAERRFDPLERHMISEHLSDCTPDIIINLIGQTNLSQNERDPELAYRINAGIPEEISHFINSRSSSRKPTFIHISTDHLYEGENASKETEIHPKNVYAMTKLLGDYAALKGFATVLRTNYIGRSLNRLKPTFTDWVTASLRENKKIKAFEDVSINGLHLSTLCSMIDKTLKFKKTGIYNLGCNGQYTKADIIIYLAEHLGVPLDRVEICKADFADGVKRPRLMNMDVSKFEREFSVSLPHFSEEFKKLTNDYSIST